jgi:branched-chain amino acid transport system ATP-binding protein
MVILSIKALRISFGGIQALAGVDMDVQREEILCMIGPNGSGKTTLFNCICGVYLPDGGEILFKGERVTGLSPHSVAKRGVARTFQNLRLFQDMTVLDNMLLGRHIRFARKPLKFLLKLRHEESRHRRFVEEIIEFLDLQPYRKSRVSDCPYGIQKFVEIGRALAMEPDLLLLDEPVAGLTSREKEEAASLINEIRGRHEMAIFMVEHDLGFVSKLADRMIVLDYGRKIAEGSPEMVQRTPEVIRAYLGDEQFVAV